MKLDFDIEVKGESLDFELKDTKVINTGGGVSENRVVQIVGEKTKELQPKVDESLETESKQVVGAINEVNSGLVKGIDSSITEETNELVLELKGKDGTVLFSTKVQLPKGEVPDLSAYVKTEDRDSFVQQGIVKNSLQNTDEEKASACDWLGALPNKRPANSNNGDGFLITFGTDGKTLGYKRLYGSYVNAPNSVPYRDSKGVIHGKIPTTETGLTPKDYVDNLPDKLTLTEEQKAKWRAWLGIE